MPIYDYQCQSCGHTFDVLQRMSENLLKDCPECGKAELKKLVSTPKIHFKGKGWNATKWKEQPPQARSVKHRFDSATPHEEHDHSHGHSHDHGSHSHGDSHGDKKADSKGHSHDNKPGHKHDH
jgi:putative FmdB family regulatory protein